MRALVCGYGRMGSFHAKVLRDLGYEVVTVDPNPERMADHATLDEAIPPIVFGTTGMRPKIDVVAIAVPPDQLLPTAYHLAGLPMLVEKPFALNVRDASMLAAYLAQKGSKVCVGLVERFNPQVRALRALLMDGTIRGASKIKFTRWNDRPSFDVGLDLRLHDVDLMHFLTWGREVEFETQDRCDRKVRTIELTHDEGTLTVDLMDHALSPLHGLWHAFLTDKAYPKPSDVIWALEVLPSTYAAELAVAA